MRRALAKELAAELRAKYDLKQHSCRSTVLITKFDHDPSRAVGSARHKRCSWPIGAAACAPQAIAAQATMLGHEWAIDGAAAPSAPDDRAARRRERDVVIRSPLEQVAAHVAAARRPPPPASPPPARAGGVGDDDASTPATTAAP